MSDKNQCQIASKGTCLWPELSGWCCLPLCEIIFKKGKICCATAAGREEWKNTERNSPADTKVDAEGGGGSSRGAGAKVPLWHVEMLMMSPSSPWCTTWNLSHRVAGWDVVLVSAHIACWNLMVIALSSVLQIWGVKVVSFNFLALFLWVFYSRKDPISSLSTEHSLQTWTHRNCLTAAALGMFYSEGPGAVAALYGEGSNKHLFKHESPLTSIILLSRKIFLSPRQNLKLETEPIR